MKNPSASEGDAGDSGSIPGWGRSPGGGNGNPLQYSCWDNRMDTGAWQGTVHGVAESDMIEQLSMHSQSSCAFPALELLFHVSVGIRIPPTLIAR